MAVQKYYDAYDDRYRQVHEQNLAWFGIEQSEIVGKIIHDYSLTDEHRMLEIGCGEGRDAFPLLEKGYRLLATDVSPEAIAYCQKRMPGFAEHFRVLDCITGRLDIDFDFIFAVAVVHMLVLDEDRDAFYAFIREHLNHTGIALICSMGDGGDECQTDPRTAFELQDRIHEQTGKAVRIARTSCRMVNFLNFHGELERNGLAVIRQGLTSIEPDFPQMMYAVVRKQ